MRRYSVSDFELSSSGDLILENGDIKLTSGDDYIIQQITNRLSRSNPEWFHDSIHADLEDLLGMPNNNETALMGMFKISDALTHDGFISEDDIYIESTPVSQYEIIFILFVRGQEEGTIVFEIDLDLSGEVSIRRV